MTLKEKLTEDQLNEVKEFAKTKTLKEIASYFNMNKSAFMLLRKQQPEIDIIYNSAPKEKRCKIYTPEEIIEIEEMASTLSIEGIVSRLGTTIYFFQRSRNNQPELDAALIRGVESRDGNFNYSQHLQKKSKKEELLKEQNPQTEKKREIEPKATESLSTRAPDDIFPEEAIIRFRKLKTAERRKQQLEELKKIDF